MSAIELAGVAKHWRTPDGQVRAVDRISFTVEAGTLCVLLGPSGCGKSTTLRLIAGLETADEGRITIAGRDVTHAPPTARNIAMVFQSYALFPHLSVEENIVFGLRVRRVPTEQRAERLAQVAELLGLTPLLRRKPAQLSGGQQQRVALGRAIIAQAPVCLMDEPLSNLDAQLRAEMRQEIRALQLKLGITMVYVTHDQIEAMSMADRIVLLNAGKVEQTGTPVDLYETPANAFVARFIGTPPMNLLDLQPGRDATLIAGTETAVPVPAPFAAGRIGVRPEHITLAHDRGIPAMVETIEYLGGDSLITCRVGTQVVAVRVPGNVALRRGDATTLAWAPGAQHVFDAEGRRREMPESNQPATMLA